MSQSWGYCKKCGGFLNRDGDLLYMSNPPMVRLKCTKCEDVTYKTTTRQPVDK